MGGTMVRARPSAVASRRARASSSPLPRKRRPGHPLAVECLEGRTLLATFVVTDAGDAGPGTLRQAILDANALAGADTINFNIPGDDPVVTIRPLSPLPIIIGTTTIDGTTQPGAKVELDGSLAGLGANGLTLFNDTTTTSTQP